MWLLNAVNLEKYVGAGVKVLADGPGGGVDCTALMRAARDVTKGRTLKGLLGVVATSSSPGGRRVQPYNSLV